MTRNVIIFLLKKRFLIWIRFMSDFQPIERFEDDFYYVEQFNDDLSPIIPPCTNRGGIQVKHCETYIKLFTPPTRKILVIVDYLTVVFHESALENWQHLDFDCSMRDQQVRGFLEYLKNFVSDLDYMPRDKGVFGYSRSLTLMRGVQNVGLLAYGGNHGGVMLSLSGLGCAGVDMVKLRHILEVLPDAHITRIDVAHDDLEGHVPFWVYKRWADLGRFNSKGTPPSKRFIDDFNSGAGKTLYIGKKSNGKEACIYEKGKLLGDVSSPWVRVEGRFTNVDRVLPFDLMTAPEMYLAAMYPPFSSLCAFHERIKVVGKQVKITYDSLVKYASISYGRLINTMLQIGKTADEIVTALSREGMPRRLALIPLVRQ